jgi:hypothetical protein
VSGRHLIVPNPVGFRPTVYLCWVGEPRDSAARGPHHKLRKVDDYAKMTYTIAANPDGEERGDGTVFLFVPLAAEVAAVKARTLEVDELRKLLEARWDRALREAMLQKPFATLWNRGPPRALHDGDVLTCRCEPGRPCHRRWLAPYLVRAGWLVVVDGEPYRGGPL